jgi:hypothetical protein
MIRILVIITFLYSFQSSYGQNFGLRGNIEFSNSERINNAIGGGLYLDITDSSKKIELLFSGDYCKYKKTFSDKGFESDYLRYYFSINCFYVFHRSEKSKIRIGAFLNHSTIDAGDNFMYGTINAYKSKFIGTGLTGNLEFKKVFKLPINFDIFVSPTYLINIKNENDPTGIKSDYSKNLIILNVQLGISYAMK